MIRDCLSRPWRYRFVQQHGRKPVVQLVGVHNLSGQPIDVRDFDRRIKMTLVSSGMVLVTKNAPSHDYSLTGVIIANISSRGDHEVKTYIVTMMLTRRFPPRRVWKKVQAIKKLAPGP